MATGRSYAPPASKPRVAAKPYPVAVTGAASLISHDSILLTHAEPVQRVYVLFHGLTASPRQFEAFGRMLHERGANVYIPRLPRHGLADRLTTELEGLTAEELRAFGLASVAFARTLAPRLHVVGFSVGGLLAAWVAQHVTAERVTCVAPFLGVAFVPKRFVRGAAYLARSLPNRFLWWDPIQRERQMPDHGYPRFATHAVAEALGLAQDVMAEAERRGPEAREVQIVLNSSESTVSNLEARRLAALWSARKENRIVLHRLRGLPPSHDIIEPLRSPAVARRVASALLGLVER
jgi:pimeloyl-ACP methyl ester carboxylesterase